MRVLLKSKNQTIFIFISPVHLYPLTAGIKRVRTYSFYPQFSEKFSLSAEQHANLNTGGQYGFMVLDPQWGLSTGVQKTVLKNKGTVSLNITDIFWTNLPKAVITYNNYVEKWHAFRETWVANLSFTYRFGNNKVQAATRRTTASEEERQRAGN